MFPERNIIGSVTATDGKVYNIHRGRLSSEDRRGFWGEGPDIHGVMRPFASFWNEHDARRWLATHA